METFEHVALSDLKPSPFNPRTSFDADNMDDLIASLESGGIHEPLIGRRVNSHIEIVAGERRYRAAKKAKLETVPVIVKELTDAQAMEIQIIENEQREDINDLDQAAGLHKLQALDPATYTVEELGRRLGLKASSVYARLKLLQLVPEAQHLLRAGSIDTGHGVLIARLTERDQKGIVKWMGSEAKFNGDEYPSVAKLKAHIARTVKIDLFSPLVAEQQPRVAAKLEKMAAAGIAPVLISRSYTQTDKDVKTPQEYREVGKKKCESSQVGAVAYGEEVELVDVCLDKKCKVHWKEEAQKRAQTARQTRQAKESPAAKAKREAAEQAATTKRELEEASKGAVLVAILEGVKKLDKAEIIEMLCITISSAEVAEFKTELEALELYAAAKPTSLEQMRKGLSKLSDRQLAQLAVFSTISDRLHGSLPAVAKEHGVDVKAIQKQLAKLQTAAPEEGTPPKTKKRWVKKPKAKASKKR